MGDFGGLESYVCSFLAGLGAVSGDCRCRRARDVCAVNAVAGARDQRWSDVGSPFQSPAWSSGAQGANKFTRLTCSDNNPARAMWTTFTLFHHRRLLPDENKGPMLLRKTCSGVNFTGQAFSNDTEDHYWKLTFNHGASWERMSGSGRVSWP